MNVVTAAGVVHTSNGRLNCVIFLKKKQNQKIEEFYFFGYVFNEYFNKIFVGFK